MVGDMSNETPSWADAPRETVTEVPEKSFTNQRDEKAGVVMRLTTR